MLTIDFETRSQKKLSGKGAVSLREYAMDPSTEVLCLAIKRNRTHYLWVPAKFIDRYYEGRDKSPETGVLADEVIDDKQLDELMPEINAGYEAHNVGFELEIWHFIMHKRYGFEDLNINKAHDSMAKCMAAGIPAALGNAAEALRVTEQKDKEGAKIMKRLCQPVKVTKKTPNGWDEDPIKFFKLCNYCIQDTVAEESVSQALPDLNKQELWVMRHTLKINRRGIPIDRSTVGAICKIVDKHKRVLDMRMRSLTSGAVESVSVRAQVQAYLRSRGLALGSMDANSVAEALESCKDRHCLQILQCYQDGAKTSVAKFDAMYEQSRADGAIHNFMVYHKAITGRFASRGCQVHNMPRTEEDFDIEEVVEDVVRGYEWFAIYNDNVLGTLSQAVRGCIHARDGEVFICYDFSAIEGRVLAWLAGEHHIIKGYRNKLDMYKVAASAVFSEYTYDTMPKTLRQIGKVIELACGYQGSVGAYLSMEANYGIDTLELLEPDSVGTKGAEDRKAELIKALVYKWRGNRPKTVKFWRDLEDAAVEAMSHKGEHVRVGKVTFRYEKIGNMDWLVVDLPSGRSIRYAEPKLKMKTVFDQPKKVVEYMKVNPTSGRWFPAVLYGGLIAENVTQAVARDFLTDAFPYIEAAGFPIVFHVHDEVVASVKDGTEAELKADAEELEGILTTLPDWCDDSFPLEADGWIGKRYRK